YAGPGLGARLPVRWMDGALPVPGVGGSAERDRGGSGSVSLPVAAGGLPPPLEPYRLRSLRALPGQGTRAESHLGSHRHLRHRQVLRMRLVRPAVPVRRAGAGEDGGEARGGAAAPDLRPSTPLSSLPLSRPVPQDRSDALPLPPGAVPDRDAGVTAGGNPARPYRRVSPDAPPRLRLRARSGDRIHR